MSSDEEDNNNTNIHTHSDADCDAEDDDITPFSVNLNERHKDPEKCILCNYQNKRYLTIDYNYWRKLHQLIKRYKKTRIKEDAFEIINYYDEHIKIPANKLIAAGQCTTGVVIYPDINIDIVDNHILSYSAGGCLEERCEKITAIAQIYEDNLLLGKKSNSTLCANRENMDIYIKLVRLLYNISSTLNNNKSHKQYNRKIVKKNKNKNIYKQ